MNERVAILLSMSIPVLFFAKRKLFRFGSHFRFLVCRLVMENEDLRGQMKQTERDTIDVITYLKTEDQTKDEQIFKLQLVSKLNETRSMSSLIRCEKMKTRMNRFYTVGYL